MDVMETFIADCKYILENLNEIVSLPDIDIYTDETNAPILTVEQTNGIEHYKFSNSLNEYEIVEGNVCAIKKKN